MQPTALPRWAQWTIGIGVTGIALSATALSMAVTVSYGASISPAAAAASALSDLTLAAIPIISAAFGWTPYRRALLVVCAAWSVFTAASYFADEHAAHILERTTTARHATGLAARVDDLESTLGSFRNLPATDAIEQRLAIVAGQVEREAARGGCGTECEKLVAKQDRITARLGRAQQRDRIAAELKAVRARASSMTPVEPSGLALLASSATGIDKGALTQALQAFAIIAVLALIELTRHMIGTGARIIAAAWSARPAAAPATAALTSVDSPASLHEVEGCIPAPARDPESRGRRALERLAGVAL